MADEKKFTMKELQVVCKSLNTVEGIKIKYVGVTTDLLAEEFKATVIGLVNEGKTDSIPDDVVDFFNANFDMPKEKSKKKGKGKKEAKAPEVTEAPKAEKKSKTPKAEKVPKKVKEAKTTKEPKTAKRGTRDKGITSSAVALYLKGKSTSVKDIVEKLQPKFPNVNLHHSVSHVVRVLKHIPVSE